MVRSERGVTLMELLTVVGVVATMALVALPSFSRWRGQAQYRKVASEIVQLLREARTRAISRNLEQRVEFELANRRYRLTEGNRSSRSTSFATVVVDWIALPEDVALMKNLACNSEADSNLEFNPNGTSQTGYVCVVEAAAPANCHFRVGVSSSICGRPTVR
ncbi:hypothetical protein JCM30471_01050 [Desulfuromonas carbonis]|uniref:GspH/FimT family pseudopilin n=1 Tax=Desulfuromonas sp. DDH964 TaxID=1823759 RepID=UPI00078BAAE4|nr:GspH/FimT family pseudopilin [Desulfuromonas sp. DDH964]AMV71834.1 hypothetical protein DBW_1473 [Desulfuromonas sp. DDH964]